ncbi:hypothetical protein [Kitasatospora sp. MAP12-44]|uniref:hypothetical protein n=1 Tax=unclassified Kitasatospora TaxID=2633591 RepID=UPI002477260E|nr:hypothetical protein [Kitasatospora sp. MAP12-44]
MLVEIHLNQHLWFSGIVREHQSQLPVEVGAFRRLGAGEDGDEVGVGSDEGGDVVVGVLGPACGLRGAECGFGFRAGRLIFGDPAGHEDGVGARFEGGAVGGEFGVALLDRPRPRL